MKGTTRFCGVFPALFHGIPARWGIKPAIITRRLAVHRRNVFMVLPRGQLISIRYCGFIACSLPPGPLIDPRSLDHVVVPPPHPPGGVESTLVNRAVFRFLIAVRVRAANLVFRWHDFWINPARRYEEEWEREGGGEGEIERLLSLEYYFSRMIDSFFFFFLFFFEIMRNGDGRYRRGFYFTRSIL